MMVLKNASRFVSDHTSDLADIEIVNGNNLIALRSFKLLNHDLDLTETGLPVCGRNILLSCLPGVEDQYFDRIVLLHSFDLDDDISWIRSTIPKFRNDLVIHRVYANKYYPDLVQVLKDMENKGITIHTIILSDCYKQFKEHEKKELLKLKSRIDISQSYSSDSIPPTDTWTLKSVIQ
ncbi:hypothetical protein C9374_002023 [Naegleria lovaniensis]|uniref:Uncharacterized protein n=1 Tax=Naegleria lovaniensis TaxID=51637 RepID=A0AA88GVB7_NAELO|nr:uncharacterized protein C9374_002023 [Naegleria lovaniensis]KAG2386988.1 hypothetical protein C9374_002023 [Naegleria lovaniensis]